MVAALLMVGLFGGAWRRDTPETSYAHIGLAVLVALYNIFYFFAVKRSNFGQEGLASVLWYAQVPIDLLVFTAIVHFSGGVTGPVFVLYFLYIFVGLAILPPSGTYFVAGTAAACYGALALVEMFWMKPPQTPPPPLGLYSPASLTGPSVIYAGYFLTVSATLIITAYIANFFARLLTRDESTIRQQFTEINTLYAFTRATSNAVSTEEVIDLLVSSAMKLEGVSACSLLTFNEKGEGRFVATSGLSPEQRAEYDTNSPPARQTVVKALLADGKGVYAPDVDAVAGLRSVLASSRSPATPMPNTRSFYGIPMSNEEQLVGTLNLSFDKPFVMPMSLWSLLSAMTQQAALAIERIRLFTDAQRSAKEMAGLYQVGLVTTSSLQIDEVLRLIYEQVNRVLHPDTFYIALYDEDVGELCYDIFLEDGEMLPPFKTRLDNVGISGWVIRNRKPVFIRNWDTEIEQLPFETNLVGAPTQSLISVPLIAKNKTVGVMSVQALRAEVFDHNHLRLLTSIASQAALALENAKLHATVNEQAQRDSLTGAYNHGTLIDKLHNALRGAQSERNTVALIMLDLDRFKQYNDTYGHLVGDEVLRSTVTAIQNHIKGTDFVGRWGGEEFAVILPGVNRTQAKTIAERIRKTVETNVIKDLHNRSIPSPTICQGIATYPDDATRMEELIDKADAALFRAKELGRNRISEWIDMQDGPPEPLSLRASG